MRTGTSPANLVPLCLQRERSLLDARGCSRGFTFLLPQCCVGCAPAHRHGGRAGRQWALGLWGQPSLLPGAKLGEKGPIIALRGSQLALVFTVPQNLLRAAG